MTGTDRIIDEHKDRFNQRADSVIRELQSLPLAEKKPLPWATTDVVIIGLAAFGLGVTIGATLW